MILKSVNIENFRCIEETSSFTLDRVTSLVGKNEAGKTAILQALYKLNPDVEDNGEFDYLSEYPRRKLEEYEKVHSDTPANVLTTIWDLQEDDRKVIEKELFDSSFIKDQVKITRGYDNTTYWELIIDEKKLFSSLLANFQLSKDELDLIKEVNTVNDLLQKLRSEEKLSQNFSSIIKLFTDKIPNDDIEEYIISLLEKQLPIFLYFSDYYKLSGQISLDNLLSRKANNQLEPAHRVFLALLDLAGSNIDELKTIDEYERQVAKLEIISKRLTRDILEYWTQNKNLEVVFAFDNARPKDPPPYNSGYIFRTRIRDIRDGFTVGFDKRSAGFVWFFSFFVWFSQVTKNYGKKLIVLLDDPGLNLHARAQEDLLRFIRGKLEPNYQVIYTTHSPFMLDTENLNSVRTVEDVETHEGIRLGTKVGSDILSTDPDTILPLQTVLGIGITQSLFIGKHTLLVEGPSDILYLEFMSKELKENGKEFLDRRWVITHTGGIDNIKSFVSLFGGNKLHVAVFCDLHIGQKKKVELLRDSGLIQKDHVLCADKYAGQEEADTEDLIGRDNYIFLINKCFTLSEAQQLPNERAEKSSARVLKEVEDHFAKLPPEAPGFNHYSPALFLTENSLELKPSFPNLELALDKFESLFKDLNKLL